MKKELFFKSDVENAINLLEYFILGKKEQIEMEPNEEMWKDQLRQLYGTSELLDFELECFEDKE